MNKIATIIATVAACAATACTSYEIDMPANPDAPVVGNEVSSNVIYQANPRFFADNNCLNALTAQLSRIAGMDCDILWVMPVYETGELNAFGSPYCVRNFTAINPKYGTMTDMKELVNTAHAKGMKVILDWVANHTAWDCAWVTEHPDWYVQDEDGNIISPKDWPDVAQLNFDNAAMRAAMTDAIYFWVDQLAIDGFRFDYAEGVPQDYWKTLNSGLRDKNPEMILLAEASNPEFYSLGFNMIYDWNSAPTISGAFNGGKPASVVTEAADALAKVPDGESILRYVFNHDVAAENNVATMYGSPEGVPAAYVLASMLNGTPMIYSSMDVEGLSGKLSFFDYRTLDFSTALSKQYAAINAAFKASAEVRRGELTDFSNNSVVCFTRAIPGHNLLVAVNTTKNEQTVKAPIVLGGANMTDLITGASVTVPVEITLNPYGYTILMN